LKSYELPKKDFAVFGSGPMYVAGLREQINDVDVICRGEAWEKSKDLEKHDQIDFFNSWMPGKWNVDDLIDQAEEIDGMKFVQLKEVLKWKKIASRDKDKEDIEILETHFN